MHSLSKYNKHQLLYKCIPLFSKLFSEAIPPIDTPTTPEQSKPPDTDPPPITTTTTTINNNNNELESESKEEEEKTPKYQMTQEKIIHDSEFAKQVLDTRSSGVYFKL